MIHNFSNKIARDIWESDFSKKLPVELNIRAKALLTIMHSISTLEDLKIKGQPPNIRLHKLKGDRKKGWSVTVGHSVLHLSLKMMVSTTSKLKITTRGSYAN